LIVIGYVGCDWFWLDLIQAVSLTATLQSPDGNIGAFVLWRNPLVIAGIGMQIFVLDSASG
ncbi:hypothetical protein, partial [Aeromonas veronii]|uniref:hypothetical protein n=1 Tax=Aeromonas veronii TaxID=654 RepID=UPI003EC67230